MRILIILLISFFVFSCHLSNTTSVRNNSFFPESVNHEMQTDLLNFVQKIPKNKGQQEHIERIIQNLEYKNILLFIDNSFSPEVINRVSQLKAPFCLIEVLDILSYNQKLNDSFSNWYLSKLASLVNDKPQKYITLFLRLTQKSDGMYSEWFSDPLAKIIKTNTEEFAKGLEEIEDREKMCKILKTGDNKLVADSIKALRIYNNEHKNKAVAEFLNCFD